MVRTNYSEEDNRLKAVMGPRLRAARKALGLRPKTVAKQVGLATEFYRRIERGHAFPSLGKLIKLADILDVSVDHLFGVDSQEPILAPTDQEPQITEIVDRCRKDPDLRRFVDRLLKYCEQLDRRDPLTIDPTRRDLALTIWPEYVVDTAVQRPVDDICSYLAFWRNIDQRLLQDILMDDSTLSYFANYMNFIAGDHRRHVIQVMVGMHDDERGALEPSVFGALLDHGFNAVRAAVRGRLSVGDPRMLDRLHRAIMRSYSPRNSSGIVDAGHRREMAAWRKLMTVLLDPHIEPGSLLDALDIGIADHLQRGMRQGTIEASAYESASLRVDTKHGSHETVLLRAYRLLMRGY